LIERFALLEAQQINLYLKMEKRKEVILEIAKAFNWQVKSEGDFTWLHFAKYLENASRGRLVHDTKWKIVNRALEKGYVSVTPDELSRLLQEEVKKRIEDSAKNKVGDLPEEIQKDIDEIKAEFVKLKPQLEEMDHVIRAQESEYPPCISILMKRAAEGKTSFAY